MIEENIIRYLLDGTLKEKICRVCLCEAENLLPISGNFNETNLTIKELIMCISSLEIDESSNMPENICKICSENIYNAYEFRVKCEDTDALLNNCISCFYQQVRDLSEENTNNHETILIVLPEDGSDVSKDCKIIKEEPEESIDSIVMQKTNERKTKNKEYKNEMCSTNVGQLFKVESVESIDNIVLNPANENGNDILKMFLDKASEFNQDANVKHEDIKKKKDSQITSNREETYDCTMCFLSFDKRSELRVHENTHSENARHFCRICLRSYRKLSILKRHLITHSGNKSFTCNHCGKSFYHKNALRTHLRYHGEKKYGCKICLTRFHFRHRLIEHLNENHPDLYTQYGDELMSIDDTVKEEGDIKSLHEDFKREFDCTMCTESFLTQNELDLHKICHPEGMRHTCRTCGRSYLEVGSLKRHMVSHTGKKTYLCTFCGKTFFFRNILKSHMIYHGEKRQACEFCNKKFHTRHILREHIRLAHSDEKYNYMCELCGKLCSSKSRLQIHRDGHNKIFCNQCGKSYKNMRYFKDHLKKHNGIVNVKKEFVCDYCGVVRNLKTLLELHILSKHLNERRYKCNLCNKAFFTKGTLNEHGVVHTKIKAEQCDICNKHLVNRKALVLHKRLHSGERPFPCSICGERFLSSSRRMVHIKSRHGERTECCTVCPAKFHLRSDLNKHSAIHSKEPKKLKKDFVTVQYTSEFIME